MSIPTDEALPGSTLSPYARKLRDRFRELTGFRRTIIHELGHAVVATYLRQPLLSVTVEGCGNLAGACEYDIGIQDLGNNELTANHAVVTAAAQAAVVRALIGHEMTREQFVCSIDSNQDEYRHDEINLIEFAKYLNISDTEFDLWRSQQRSRASEILETPYVWVALLRLAKELKREETLSGVRVREVLEQSRIEGA
jgi:hypothetical protein